MRTGKPSSRCRLAARLRPAPTASPVQSVQNFAPSGYSKSSATGFTLVEVIITLLVAMILGTIVYQYMGSSLARSGTGLKRQQARLQLNTTAENIIGAFRQTNPTSEADWNSLRSSIGAPGTTQNNSYGQYEVITSAFIQFDASGLETSDVYGTPPENILKTTLQNTTGEQLTFLLVN